MNSYPINLTEKQRQVIKKIVETKERKRKHSLRKMINAMMYMKRTDIRGEYIPINLLFSKKSTSTSKNEDKAKRLSRLTLYSWGFNPLEQNTCFLPAMGLERDEITFAAY